MIGIETFPITPESSRGCKRASNLGWFFSRNIYHLFIPLFGFPTNSELIDKKQTCKHSQSSKSLRAVWQSRLISQVIVKVVIVFWYLISLCVKSFFRWTKLIAHHTRIAPICNLCASHKMTFSANRLRYAQSNALAVLSRPLSSQTHTHRLHTHEL